MAPAADSAVTQVSIVTPFLNSEAHLAEAIASVRSQTVPGWELLLVDDGSTDGSPVIARSAADADERIRLIVRSAGAPHSAAAPRNAGIAAARGQFLAFLDADDLYEPHMLATTLDALERHPDAGMVFGPTRWWYPDGGGHSLVRALRLARSPYRLDPGLRDRLDRLALAAHFARRRLRRWLARHFFRLRTR